MSEKRNYREIRRGCLSLVLALRSAGMDDEADAVLAAVEANVLQAKELDELGAPMPVSMPSKLEQVPAEFKAEHDRELDELEKWYYLEIQEGRL